MGPTPEPTAADAVVPAGLPGHLRLLDVVGRGATATVWRARDRRAGRDVAVKVLARSTGADAATVVERFEHEVRALARLAEHRHVLPLLAAGIDDEAAWFVTPLAERSLAAAVLGDGPLGPGAVARLGVDLAGALAAAHDLEVVHGDVTPANVLWVDGVPVLADFGLAVLGRPLDQHVGIAGDRDPAERTGAPATPGWAAPEVLDGAEVTAASDVYGLGATLWTAAVGERPATHRPPDASTAPRGLDAIVAACCDPVPSARPTAATVRSMAEAEGRRRSRYCPEP